mgnify:CR=1 FL=1
MNDPINRFNQTLADAIPVEQARVREVLGHYRDIGPNGRFGAIMIERDLAAMDRAVVSGDLVEMIQCYQKLREIE